MPRKKLYLFRAGYPGRLADLSPELRAAADEVYEFGLSLARPAVRSRTCPVGLLPLYSVPDRFSKSKTVTIYVATLGAALDEAIERFFSAGEALRGTLLDAWGSESVEALANRFDDSLRTPGRQGTIRFSPGYGNVPVTANADLAGMIGDCPVNVDRKTGIMIPRKSVLCMIGWEE